MVRGPGTLGLTGQRRLAALRRGTVGRQLDQVEPFAVEHPAGTARSRVRGEFGEQWRHDAERLDTFEPDPFGGQRGEEPLPEVRPVELAPLHPRRPRLRPALARLGRRHHRICIWTALGHLDRAAQLRLAARPEQEATNLAVSLDPEHARRPEAACRRRDGERQWPRFPAALLAPLVLQRQSVRGGAVQPEIGGRVDVLDPAPPGRKPGAHALRNRSRGHHGAGRHHLLRSVVGAKDEMERRAVDRVRHVDHLAAAVRHADDQADPLLQREPLAGEARLDVQVRRRHTTGICEMSQPRSFRWHLPQNSPSQGK